MDSINVQIMRLSPSAVIPKYESEGAACVDLRLCLPDGIDILPGEQLLLPTGLAMGIPVGYELQIRPRSGLAAKKEITITNSPGTIDADYRGEIKVILKNGSDERVLLDHGDRICQAKLALVPRANFIEVDELSNTERGTGGFGSTGVN
jgi:dUTP pyrophosphatase